MQPLQQVMNAPTAKTADERDQFATARTSPFRLCSASVATMRAIGTIKKPPRNPAGQTTVARRNTWVQETPASSHETHQARRHEAIFDFAARQISGRNAADADAKASAACNNSSICASLMPRTSRRK